MKCKNKNFSFRIICNRCRLKKEESNKLYDEHMYNLSELVKQNEMLQNQIFNQNYQNLGYNNSNMSAFNPNLFSPNSSYFYENINNNNHNSMPNN